MKPGFSLGLLVGASLALPAFALSPLSDDEMSDVNGEGIATIIENFDLDSPGSPLYNYGYVSQSSFPSQPLGLSIEAIPEGQETGDTSSPGNPNVNDGILEYSRYKMTNVEIGDVTDAGNIRAHWGNSNWDDPVRLSVQNNILSLQLPGNLDYGAAGKLMGPDRLPLNTEYGFVDPDSAGAYSGPSDGPLKMGQYTFKDFGNVYRFPHEEYRTRSQAGLTSNYIDIVGVEAPYNTPLGYTIAELAPVHNFNVQMDLLIDAEPTYIDLHRIYYNDQDGDGTADYLGPANPGNEGYVDYLDNTVQNGIPAYSRARYILSQDTNGYHRMGTLRITGLHSGRTANPSVDNPNGLNGIYLKTGGYEKAITLPDFHCYSAAYINSAGRVNFNRGGTQTNAGNLVRTAMLPSSNPCLGGAGGGVWDPNGIDESVVVKNGNNSGTLLQSEAIPPIGGSPSGFFNAYPKGHDSYRRDINNKPILRGGLRGVLEINHLRIDDIRFSRTRDIDNPNWGATPSHANRLNFRDREMWLTDLEIRDLRIGSFQIDSNVNQTVNDPARFGYGVTGYYENTNFGNEIAPLSLTFANDPFHGRVLELFMPYHNAAAVGNGDGRVSFYVPYIGNGPTSYDNADGGGDSRGKCCGAVVIDGIQLDFLQYQLFLD